MIKVTEQQLDVQQALSEVSADESGAVNIFTGTVRRRNHEKEVVRLEYEAYESMAVSEIEKIVSEAGTKWAVKKAAVHHRTGILNVGDIAVIVAVSTPHRKDSFEACRFIIDELKKKAPIWKKEVYQSGETWIAAHP